MLAEHGCCTALVLVLMPVLMPVLVLVKEKMGREHRLMPLGSSRQKVLKRKVCGSVKNMCESKVGPHTSYRNTNREMHSYKIEHWHHQAPPGTTTHHQALAPTVRINKPTRAHTHVHTFACTFLRPS